MTTSWAPEVFVEGRWSRNGLRFATEAEAIAYAKDLHARWTMTRDYRATESDEPVNKAWDLATPERLVRPRAPDDGGVRVEVVENIGDLLRGLGLDKTQE